jgi:hypothetical protein
VGHDETKVKAFVDYGVHYEITPADLASNVYRIPIPAGKTVLGVRARTMKAFVGGSPTVKIGDASDDDGFLETDDIDITTLNTVVDSRNVADVVVVSTADTWTPNGYFKGKHYASAGQLICTFAAGATDGKLGVDVLFSGFDSARPADMIANY